MLTTQIEERAQAVRIPQRIWTRTWFIFLIALGLRLAVVPFFAGGLLDLQRDHWGFGWEAGRIARSLASGHGFSSPFSSSTGPTAWMGPTYPALLAAVFKLFGIYSQASAYAILSLNCFFAALTCFPLRFIAVTAFGESVALLSTWTWALFPYSIDFSGGLVWPTVLTALLFTSVIAMTIALERNFSPRRWIFYGVVCALAALTEPALLPGLAASGLWLAYRLRRRGLPWTFFWRTALAGLVFLLCVSPWFLRNQRVFGRFVPFRSNFWLVLYQGNTWDSFDLYPDWANPPHNPSEMAQYARLGEVAYMTEKRQQAIAEIRDNPGRFIATTLRRIVFTWTGAWNLSPEYRRAEPFTLPNIIMTSLLTFLSLRGLAFAFRSARRFAFLFATVLLVFPAVYYITHPSMEYRHPLDTLLVLLSVSGFFARATKPKIESAASDLEPKTADHLQAVFSER